MYFTNNCNCKQIHFYIESGVDQTFTNLFDKGLAKDLSSNNATAIAFTDACM